MEIGVEMSDSRCKRQLIKPPSSSDYGKPTTAATTTTIRLEAVLPSPNSKMAARRSDTRR